MQTWTQANQWEKSWWGDCLNTFDEEQKQSHYARLMNIDYDLHNQNIVDIGGGPISLLLKCKNRGSNCRVVDPCQYPDWVMERYRFAGIKYLQYKAEDYDISADQVWMYNCIQHCECPSTILKNLVTISQKRHIFEWINNPIGHGHLHVITAALMEQYLGKGRVVPRPYPNYEAEAWVMG